MPDQWASINLCIQQDYQLNRKYLLTTNLACWSEEVWSKLNEKFEHVWAQLIALNYIYYRYFSFRQKPHSLASWRVCILNDGQALFCTCLQIWITAVESPCRGFDSMRFFATCHDSNYRTRETSLLYGWCNPLLGSTDLVGILMRARGWYRVVDASRSTLNAVVHLPLPWLYDTIRLRTWQRLSVLYGDRGLDVTMVCCLLTPWLGQAVWTSSV